MTGSTKVILILAAVGIAGFVAVGGDVVQDNAAGLVPPSAGIHSGKDLVPAPAAPYLNCQRLRKDGSFLRWQVAHFGDRTPLRIECSYGDRGELQL